MSFIAVLGFVWIGGLFSFLKGGDVVMKVSERKGLVAFTAVILAGGNATRMNGKVKSLMLLHGRPVLDRVLATLNEMNTNQIILVSGRRNFCRLMEHLGDRVRGLRLVYQNDDDGTGGAAKVALPFVENKVLLVLFGDDSGLYSARTLRGFLRFAVSGRYPMSLISLRRDGVTDIGGLEIKDGHVVGVMTKNEHERRGLTESYVMCGAMAFDVSWLKRNIKKIKQSPLSGEYTLPSLIYEAVSQGKNVGMYLLENEDEWNSMNNEEEYRQAESKAKRRYGEG